MPVQGVEIGSSLLTGLIYVIIILISLSFHEFAHAFVANIFGDPTAKLDGRLSLNPVNHWDPIGTTMLVVLTFLNSFGLNLPIFGWGKPVPIDERNFDNPKMHGLQAALAGPMSNLILAAVIAAIMKYTSLPNIADQFLVMAVYLNIFLMFFNILPIPPLDGSRLLRLILPDGVYYSLTTNFVAYFIMIFVTIFFLLDYVMVLSVRLTTILVG